MLECMIMRNKPLLSAGDTETSLRWEEMFVKGTGTLVLANSTLPIASGSHRVRAVDPIGSMTGTLWKSGSDIQTTNNSNLSRIIQHLLPNVDVVEDYIANNRGIWISFTYFKAALTNFPSVTRNGYTSLATKASLTSNTCGSAKYYDVTLDKIMEITPYLGSVPTEYVGSII